MQKHEGDNSYIKAELKVVIAFLCFMFITALGITNNSVVLQHYNEFERELLSYFVCESTGVSPGKTCSRSGFENADLTPYTITTNEIVLTFYPVVTLIYVVNIAEIKTGLQKSLRVLKTSKYSDRSLQRKTSSSTPDNFNTPLKAVDTVTSICPD